jgi:uncharacterized protein YjiK
MVWVLAVAACQPAPSDLSVNDGAIADARATRLQHALATPDTTSPHTAVLALWMLPQALREISGLALTSDGRLLVQNDEIGAVWEVDYRKGILKKQFMLGSSVVKGDFEGITVTNDHVYLLDSNGKLYEFTEGANGEEVPYTVHDTGLNKDCEFEGVAFDPGTNSLLMACKRVYDDKLKDALVIYRWKIKSDSAERLTRLTVPLADIIGANGWKTLHPSDITIDPFTGNYVLIASMEKAIFEITPAGAVIFSRSLPPGHEQPEGIAITRDSILMVSDEARLRPAMITLYRWP